MQEKQNGLIWFRNDLRVHDNESLSEAVAHNDGVLAIYCLDPRHFQNDRFGFQKTGKFRAKFLMESLADLRKSLQELNIPFLVFTEKPEDIIPELCAQYSISNIYFQKEWTSEEKEVENNLKCALSENISFKSFYGQFLYHPDDIEMDLKKIPEVFTVFRKHLEKKFQVRSILPIPKRIENSIDTSYSEIPNLNDLGFEDFQTDDRAAIDFKGGETEALKRLNYYFFESKKLGFYKKTRNGLLGADYSSKFSPWLANGSLSAKKIYHEVKKFEKEHYKNQSTYWLVFELIWRDYFKYISLKHGDKIFLQGGIKDRDYEWKHDERLVKEWIDGRTSCDFVNANMLELKNTGWMSNRGRQNVGSFFAKNMELDWRIGAAYFESILLDYDVHSNYGNWMYVAGVGNDPRDRKFNTSLQAERYDPNGKFRKHWLQTTLEFDA